MLNYSESDINRGLAEAAHRGTSFDPERRANGIIKEYLENMAEVDREFSQYVTDDNREALTASLEKYKAGYLARLNSYLASHSRVMSSMITGPANFPVERNEKRWQSADNKRDAWLNWRKAYLARLLRQYDPARQDNVISADDPEALAKLRTKLANLEKGQETMKAVNKIIRRDLPHQETIDEIVALGISELAAAKLLVPDYMQRTGYAQFNLTNNLANIKRLRDRIAALEQEQERREQVTGEQVINGVRVIENAEENRLQLFFPGKPAAGMIVELKRHGFHWSPKQGCWQRLLNNNARTAARQVLGQ